MANASLWVDGLRIYEASRLGMRIVEDGQIETQRRKTQRRRENLVKLALRDSVDGLRTAGDELLDPAQDAWLQDHCPTWTVPALAMMSMVDRLAAGAQVRAPGRKVIGLRNVRVHRWLSFAGGAQRVKMLGRPVGSDTVAMQLLVWEEAQPPLRAGGQRRCDPDRALAACRPALAAARRRQPEPNPYAAGVLFHGPAYQLLTELQIGDSGASYWLDLDASGVPVGALNQGLLDAATHGIPHDALWRWSRGDSGGCGCLSGGDHGCPLLRPDAGDRPRPLRGALCRLPGRRPPLPHDSRADHRRATRSGPSSSWWRRSSPRGRWDRPNRQRGAHFFTNSSFVPGMALSSYDAGTTSLSVAEVKASDWLAGTVASIYAPELAGTSLDAEQLTQLVAIKEHVARQWQIHPAQLSVTVLPSILTQRRGGGRGKSAGTWKPSCSEESVAELSVPVEVTSPLLPLNRAHVIARLMAIVARDRCRRDRRSAISTCVRCSDSGASAPTRAARWSRI